VANARALRSEILFICKMKKGIGMSYLISVSSRKLLALVLILFAFVGCTHRLVIKQYPMKEGMVPNFAGLQPVNIINAQDSAEEVLIGQILVVHKYLANLQEWTDTAVKVLKSELHERNIATNIEAQKKIKLAITDVELSFAGCTLNLKVETGDGYTRMFTGDNNSPWKINRACGGAVTRAVAAMLNDDTILAYLKY
jgi:hypothetical protein